MTKPTTFPWVVSADGLSVKNDLLDKIVCFASSEPTKEESKVNMRMIAAAPEMYEALRLLLSWHDGTNEREYIPAHMIIEKARAAIAKAGAQ